MKRKKEITEKRNKQNKKNLTNKELKILQAVSTFLTGEVGTEFLHANITFLFSLIF